MLKFSVKKSNNNLFKQQTDNTLTDRYYSDKHRYHTNTQINTMLTDKQILLQMMTEIKFVLFSFQVVEIWGRMKAWGGHVCEMDMMYIYYWGDEMSTYDQSNVMNLYECLTRPVWCWVLQFHACQTSRCPVGAHCTESGYGCDATVALLPSSTSWPGCSHPPPPLNQWLKTEHSVSITESQPLNQWLKTEHSMSITELQPLNQWLKTEHSVSITERWLQPREPLCKPLC